MLNRNTWVTPIDRLYALQRELDRMFAEPNGALESGGTFLPPMDVVETNDEILCHLEVPGISQNDLDIRVEGSVLVISGDKKVQQESTAQEGGFRSVERRYGRFERSFALPRTVNANAVRANVNNGVLTIVLPKAEESKPRRIQIDGGSTQRRLNE